MAVENGWTEEVERLRAENRQHRSITAQCVSCAAPLRTLEIRYVQERILCSGCAEYLPPTEGSDG